jgi:uncharacterized protein (DUF1778 family)
MTVEQKIEMKLLVHPNDYALATIAAQLLDVKVGEFVLIAMVNRAAEEIRHANWAAEVGATKHRHFVRLPFRMRNRNGA